MESSWSCRGVVVELSWSCRGVVVELSCCGGTICGVSRGFGVVQVWSVELSALCCCVLGCCLCAERCTAVKFVVSLSWNDCDVEMGRCLVVVLTIVDELVHELTRRRTTAHSTRKGDELKSRSRKAAKRQRDEESKW